MTLIQTQRIKPFPIILVGSDFWAGLVDWMRDKLLAEGNINKEDILLFKVIDDAEEVVDFIKKTVVV